MGIAPLSFHIFTSILSSKYRFVKQNRPDFRIIPQNTRPIRPKSYKKSPGEDLLPGGVVCDGGNLRSKAAQVFQFMLAFQRKTHVNLYIVLLYCHTHHTGDQLNLYVMDWKTVPGVKNWLPTVNKNER